MASISSLGNGGLLSTTDKIPVARAAGTNSYIFGSNILAMPLPPVIETLSFTINTNVHNNRTVICNNIAAISIVLDTVAAPGTRVHCVRDTANSVTFTAGIGAVIRSSTTGFLKIDKQYSTAEAFHVGGGVWYLSGELA